MRITAVIVTCNRLKLLSRALKSVKQQSRKSDFVYIISNSTADNFHKEQKLCADFGFQILKNHRTENYAGALNTAIEQIIKQYGISEDLYFASLDDDDEWLPNYLQEIETSNIDNFDLLVGNLLRSSSIENHLLVLPNKLSEKDFLIGNPGISGSNTFIKITTLLKSGAFDEGLSATIDRDFFVRVFLQKPKYKILNKHLVTQHTDNDRERVTTNRTKKEESLRIFFYKYQHLMNKEEKQQFFKRIEKLFSINKDLFEYTEQQLSEFSKGELVFENKGNYQFVMGFITSDETYSKRILSQILEQKISVDLIVIINNSKKNFLDKSEQILKGKIHCRIVHPTEWRSNLQTEQYGKAFSAFTEINSIPLGRTILHYHLHNETINFLRPVYWIIDDDITFNFIKTSNDQTKQINLFEIINQNIENVSAIIGSVSNDPPLPFLSSVRGQLVDLLHSHWAKNQTSQDLLNLRSKADYYYDLSDLLSNHLESPIYHTTANENAIEEIFSGKSVSRKVIQKSEIKSIDRIITQRGPNTLVLNRELLHYYPVINLSVNHKFARRGDLLWVLFNQIVSEYKIVEHTFSIQQSRTISKFDLSRELEKSAYDIIGYAFNKGFLNTIKKIKTETNPNRPKDIFEKLETENYFNIFLTTYKRFLQGRKTKFLMNYYRIIGLLEILSMDFENAKIILKQISQTNQLDIFLSLIASAESEETLKNFIKELTTDIWTYSNSVTNASESKDKHQSLIKQYFELKTDIKFLGSGSEGIAFTDNTWVYKSFFNMPIKDWDFLKEKSATFSNCSFLEKIDCIEKGDNKFIRYPFHSFQTLQAVNENEIIQFLKFCKKNQFVFTNIAPKNFIQTLSGQMKLIDYGKSFEPFTEEKFINSIKRAFLMFRFPKMLDDDFKKVTAKINIGEIPNEIDDWQIFHNKVLNSQNGLLKKTLKMKYLISSKKYSFPENIKGNFLIVGIGGGSDIVGAFATGKLLKQLNPKASIHIGVAVTPKKNYDGFTLLSSNLYQANSDKIENESDLHHTLSLVKQIISLDNQFLPYIFVRQKNNEATNLVDHRKAVYNSIKSSLDFLKPDYILALDSGGDSLTGGVSDNVEMEFDRTGVRALQKYGKPFDFVVFGPGCDGESTQQMILSSMQREIEIYKGAFNLKELTTIWKPISTKFLPSHRTPNIILSAFDNSEEVVRVPRHREPLIPSEWLKVGIVFDGLGFKGN
jgi:hypothetical protein